MAKKSGAQEVLLTIVGYTVATILVSNVAVFALGTAGYGSVGDIVRIPAVGPMLSAMNRAGYRVNQSIKSSNKGEQNQTGKQNQDACFDKKAD